MPKYLPQNWTPTNEKGFQSWYKKQAKITGIDPDPDNPAHKYDYRKAYLANKGPDKVPGGHWPSEFKDPDHPNRFVGGEDTITGKPIIAGKTKTIVVNAKRKSSGNWR